MNELMSKLPRGTDYYNHPRELAVVAYSIIDLDGEDDATIAVTDCPDRPNHTLVWVLESSDDELNDEHTDGEWFDIKAWDGTARSLADEVRRHFARLAAEAEEDRRWTERQMAAECAWNCESYNDYMGY